MQSVFYFFKSKGLWQGLLRYALALGMLPYALSKILLTQFVVMPFDLWQHSLEDTNGITLAWAFLGKSPWFQVLLGVFELIPALLLLFRRTTLTGAILMLPLTLNVMLINYALNLWEETQQISLIFFVINVLILLLDWKKIAAAAGIILSGGLRITRTGIEFLVNLAIIALFVFFMGSQLLDYRRSADFLTGDWLHNRPNQWRLQYESIADSIMPSRDQVLYFEVMRNYRLVNDGKRSGKPVGYELNEKQRTLSLKDYQNHSPAKFSYSMTGDTVLTLMSDKNWKQVYKRHVVNGK